MPGPGLFRVVLACSLLGSPVAWAEDHRADLLLQRMIQAVENLSYEGTFVYIHGQKTETMQIVHTRDERGQRERLLSLTGEPREVIRDDNILTCIWPASRSVVIEPRRSRLGGLPAAIPDRGFGPDSPYRFSLKDEQRIAGLPCRTVQIEPQDELRYAHRLCINEESGMLLKSEMVDHEGSTIEQFMFTSIQFPVQVSDDRFQSVMKGEGFSTYRVDTQPGHSDLPPDPGWKVRDIPAGFHLTSVTKRPMAANQNPVQHLVLSDGLATVSVFISQARGPDDLYMGVTQSGALHAMAVPSGDYQVTVVGEVPGATVRMIADSVTYEGGAQ
ncbi:MucB/RseB C-terminal domain-containing protein [Thioalkalivibrio thiocyanodenitrificans]|uniref:MucB/RseB C-terminal domain-containing protein n=1 Tax=Thioalkalivibrio thiocyanodenitrificans TaxID=243063 RepID=UPI00037904CF|nr:MucB/RseB C-terminal domain-containing protein [Thioalkalivibrio thiocyanodenitrificans]